ncbi:MAG: hypothetical protein CL878_12835 [Dehalococcoidia bacterium]|nr:hypothetical protein [Dehalococcoidia bacterium]
MSKLDFVDTHVHFWDLHHPDLTYSWLQPDAVHPQLDTKVDGLKQNYPAEDYIAETRNANVTKAIHVQAALGIKDPVKESEWLSEAADRTGFPHAIVAHSNLKQADVAEELGRHCEFSRVKGIRDFSDGDYLVDHDFHRGYALLEQFNLIASLDVEWQGMEKLRNLARKFPNIVAVLDHCGFPKERTDEYFQHWKQGLTTLAEAENVVCKISGLGMADWSWTTESIRPWVLACIEAFGSERCVFATNWPVDKLFSTYDVVIDAYTQIVAEFSQDEQIAMFSGNAEKLYGI